MNGLGDHNGVRGFRNLKDALVHEAKKRHGHVFGRTWWASHIALKVDLPLWENNLVDETNANSRDSFWFGKVSGKGPEPESFLLELLPVLIR